MFGKGKDGTDQVSAPVSASKTGPARQQGNGPPAAESTSAIGSGITVVGKIIGDGAVKIFGRVEGEVQASSVVIYDGGELEGNIIAQELVVGGLVKGVIHAARVKLNGTAIVEGDIFHGSLAIEENARFEGTSRRDDRLTDRASDASANGPKATTQTITQALPQAGMIDGSIGNGSVKTGSDGALPAN
jgi:cytoskeletal protein CcmA (bactofilin family)